MTKTVIRTFGDDMNIFDGILGIKSQEENILVELWSDEFFLKHALVNVKGKANGVERQATRLKT